MAIGRSRIPLGKPVGGSISSQTVLLARFDARTPVGKQRRAAFPVLNLGDLDAVYQRSLSLEREHPEQIVSYFEMAEMAARQDAVIDRLLAVRVDAYAGAPLTLFPSIGIVADATSQMVIEVMRPSVALFRGLAAGLKTQLTSDPQLAERLSKQLLRSQLLAVIAPALFASGVVVGIGQDIVKTIKGVYDLVTDFKKIANSVLELIKAILTDENAAFSLGKLIGEKLGDEVLKLSKHGVIRFTFELGRIFGPLLVYAALSLTGVGAAAAGARILKDLVRILGKFPKIKRLLDALMELAEKSKIAAQTMIVSVNAAVAARRSGMAARHVNVFRKVASARGGLNRIIAVRFTNAKSTKWIERGYPGKPMAVKVKTSKQNGIVTVSKDTPAKHIDETLNAGYYIVDKSGVARNKAGKALDLPQKTDWPLQPGQVIDGRQKRPLVGDYDLHSVINPTAKGRNIVLKSSDGKLVKDASSPDIRRVARALNDQMDQPRVMHGAHDGFADLAAAGDGVIVFHPDGQMQLFNKVSEMEAFFKAIGRQTIKGKYESGPRPGLLPDNVLDLN